MPPPSDNSMRRLARRKFDHFLEAWGERGPPSSPPSGWIAGIRQALGMSKKDLAARLRIYPSAISKLEQSERRGTIQLDTLRRAADALGCQLVVTMIPREPLESLVQRQRLVMSHEVLAPVMRHAELEGQSFSSDLVSDMARAAEYTISDSELWADLENSVLPALRPRTGAKR